jgi:release factor glutamine methyltransferase
VNEARFHNVALLTSPGRVMTPRRATEALVDAALTELGDAPARVADVGTGSGAIAVTLALLAPRIHVWATDVSPAAVELTRRNTARHGLEGRVQVVQGDLLGEVPPPIDLVVANLPYLPARLSAAYPEYAAEPADAIFAAADGLGPYRRLVAQARRRLGPDGAVLVQYRGSVVRAEHEELDQLEERLTSFARAA